MNQLDKKKIQECIDHEHGSNYYKNIPLNGYTVILGDSFISFDFKEVNNVTAVIIHYIYAVDKDDLITLMAYCTNLWSGNCAKMIYFMEHHRKSNIIKNFTHLGFVVKSMSQDEWKHAWKSTNGYKEEDCIEAFVINQKAKARKKK